MSADGSLTPRQAEILAWIREHARRQGVPPTRAELCLAFGFRSPNAAEQHLRALERKGVLTLQPGRARGIRVLDEPASTEAGANLPLIGRVAAGQPLLAVEHIEGHYAIDPRLFQPRADYLLRVYGESMRDAGIRDGDLLAVHRSPQARNGQVIVARIDDEVTVKTFQRDGERIRLLPANPDFQPIEIDARSQQLYVEGLAVGVIRRELSVD